MDQLQPAFRTESTAVARFVDDDAAAFLEQLSNSLLLQAGAVNLIGMDAIRDRMGPRWERRKEDVWTYVEKCIERLLADRAYDAASLRDWLAERGTEPVIPPNPTRKNPHAYDRDAYRGRNLIERMFCRLKDFRRIATRYDKRADIFLSAVCIAAAITWWTDN